MNGYYTEKHNYPNSRIYKQVKKLDMLTGIEAVNMFQPDICSNIFDQVKIMMYDI